MFEGGVWGGGVFGKKGCLDGRMFERFVCLFVGFIEALEKTNK